MSFLLLSSGFICILVCSITCRSTIQNKANHVHNHNQPQNDEYSSEETADFWREKAEQSLHEQLKKTHNKNVAKNLILFLGDGMSTTTVSAAGIYFGQVNGQRGEESLLSFEKFPYLAFSKTYCVNAQVADSACAGTAFMCGVKNNYNMIGVTANVTYNDCVAAAEPINQVDSIVAWAQAAGKATGIVTNTRITHATPAAGYAKTPNRDFECDSDILEIIGGTTTCEDIAEQLIRRSPGKDLNVILGGGLTKFLPNTKRDVYGIVGERRDGIDLIEEWKLAHSEGQVVFDKQGLDGVDLERTKHLLGLFAPSHMSYHLDVNVTKEPSLSDMVRAAIELLSGDSNGFFLMVEGGRIDHAHHETRSQKALDETVEFSKAIKLAKEMVDTEETLIVVTADHSHTMSFSGYSDRGQNILQNAGDLSDVDGKNYTILTYANGPGANGTCSNTGTRNVLTQFNKNTQYPAITPLVDETHGGDEVAIYANGPYAHLFSGVMEQNVIPRIMSYAGCIGKGKTACDSDCY